MIDDAAASLGCQTMYRSVWEVWRDSAVLNALINPAVKIFRRMNHHARPRGAFASPWGGGHACMSCVLVVALVALRTTIAAALAGFVLPLTAILLPAMTLFTLGRPLLLL